MTTRMSTGDEEIGPAVPALGPVLRGVRDRRGISRERLAFNAGVSASYITHLEKGSRVRPTREVLDAILRYLDRVHPLPAGEHRLLRELAGHRESAQPSVAELRAAITPELRRLLDNPLPAAIIALGGHVLECNPGWERAFPGMLENGNEFRWLFEHEQARRVLVDWDADTSLSVRALRLAMGSLEDPTAFSGVLDELSDHPDFRRMWADGGVAAVPPLWRIRLRDLEDGGERSVLVQTGMVHSDTYPGRLVIQWLLPVGTEAASGS